MLKLRGRFEKIYGFENNKTSIVLRLQKADLPPASEYDVAVVRDEDDLRQSIKKGYNKIILIGDSCSKLKIHTDIRHICISDEFNYLTVGDIVAINSRFGIVSTMYRKSSFHNAFFVTERCNNYCLMCSQPPREVNDDWLLDDILVALPLVDPFTKSLTFTGGEPLLNWQRMIGILEECYRLLPNTFVNVLTNGRAFSNQSVASKWAGIHHKKLTACIPLYSAVDYIHDHVVQARGAYDETILGILNLKNLYQSVEVRVVLHALTAPRIYETCNWISRNLPFVDHVALMGLENTGFALANEDILTIDPVDYVSELERSVNCLVTAGMNVSIYNLPRCILPNALWPFSVQSISDWKRGYLAECDHCSERQNCSGFFETGKLRRSRGIAPIVP